MSGRARFDACLAAVRQPTLRRLVVAYFAFILVETATWTATLVYAHQRGGPAEVGRAGFLLLLPAVAIAPLASFCGDRFHRVRILAVAYGAVALGCGATAAALAADAAPTIVYVFAGLVAAVITLPRPAMGALVPCVASGGTQLTAANVCVSMMQSAGMAVGPALAGVLLAAGPLQWLFAVSGVLAALAATAVAGVGHLPQADPGPDRITVGAVHHETMAGIRLLRSERGPRTIVALLGVNAAALGALDVATVVVAIDLLGRGEWLAGVLGAAFGIGQVTGAAAGVALVGRRRLAPPALAAAALQLLPLVLLAAGENVPAAAVVIGLCGAGMSVADLAGQTLLQASTPDDVMARVFGCLEGFRMACIAVGSLAASVLMARFGVATGLVTLAVGGAALVAALALPLMGIDRDRPVTDPRVVATLRANSLFSLLPAFVIERVAAVARVLDPAEGAAVIREGEAGTAMYVVDAGELTVTAGGSVVHVCRAGEVVGEVALLEDRPRNATVVAGRGARLLEVGREPFLEAVTGHPRSLHRARALADSHRPHLPLSGAGEC